MNLFQLLLYIGLVSIAALGIHYAIRKSLPNAWMSFLQYFTGFLFLVSGWVKAVDPLGTAYKMEQYFAEFELTFADTWMSFIAPVFPWLSGMSIGFSVFMIILEIILGLMLIIGAFPKWTSWAFFLLILFFTALTGFTFLTGYVPSGENFFQFGSWQAYNPNNMRVTDCGCFGDFIKLEPRISFFKDVFLLAPSILFILFSKKMHQWGTPRVQGIGLGTATAMLLVYCTSNYVWDIPHVDFRPFREGVNVAERKLMEEDALANVQVIAFKLKDRMSGTVIDVPYQEYLSGVAEKYSSDKYEVIDQVRSEPEVEETKISHFDFMDADGYDMSGEFLEDPGYKLLLVGHKLKYDVRSSQVTIRDSVFTTDTVQVEGFPDSLDLVKRFVRLDERDETVYDYDFDPDFTARWKEAVALASGLDNKDVKVVCLIGGAGQETIEAFRQAIGAEFPIYEADDILLKTIVRSNPGYVAWKGGTILRKWHEKKVDADQLNQVFAQ